MPNGKYDPQSYDVMLTVILSRIDKVEEKFTARLDTQDIALGNIRNDVCEIRTQTTATNGRVKKLEMWKAVFKSQTVLISSSISVAGVVFAWCYSQGWVKFGH